MNCLRIITIRPVENARCELQVVFEGNALRLGPESWLYGIVTIRDGEFRHFDLLQVFSNCDLYHTNQKLCWKSFIYSKEITPGHSKSPSLPPTARDHGPILIYIEARLQPSIIHARTGWPQLWLHATKRTSAGHCPPPCERVRQVNSLNPNGEGNSRFIKRRSYCITLRKCCISHVVIVTGLVRLWRYVAVGRSTVLIR